MGGRGGNCFPSIKFPCFCRKRQGKYWLRVGVSQAVTWSGEQLGASFDVTPIEESTHPLVDDALKAQAREYHEQLVELAVEQDEDVMMAYLEVRGFVLSI